jgi:hypothetical protein
MKIEFSRQFFEKSPNIKFHENSSSGSRIVPCRWMYMMKLIVAFHSVANVRRDENLG